MYYKGKGFHLKKIYFLFCHQRKKLFELKSKVDIIVFSGNLIKSKEIKNISKISKICN